MSDLISRAALFESWNGLSDEIKNPDLLIDEMIKRTQDAPAVDAEPVRHGRWVSVKDRLPKKSIISDHSVRVLISTLCGCYTAQYIFSEKLWVSDANCYVTTKKPIMLKYDDGTVDYWCPPVIYDESMGVTHWMTLPEPPIVYELCEGCRDSFDKWLEGSESNAENGNG